MKRVKTSQRNLANRHHGLPALLPHRQAKKGGNGGGGGGGDKGPSYRIVALDMDDGSGRVLDGNAFGINASRLIVGYVTDGEAEEPPAEPACWTAGQGGRGLGLGNTPPWIRARSLPTIRRPGAMAWEKLWGTRVTGTCRLLGGQEPPPWNCCLHLWPGVGRKKSTTAGSSAARPGTVLAGSRAITGPLLWYFTVDGWKYVELPPQGDPGLDDDGKPLPHRAYTNAIER